jgi:ankyrin repeat protein
MFHGLSVADATFLLDHGAPVDSTNALGQTPLMNWNYGPLVPRLIAAGADVNHRANGGITPLMVPRDDAPFAALLAARADVNATNDEGTPVLDYHFESAKQLKQLFDAGAVVTPGTMARYVSEAYEEGRYPQFALLLEHGADPHDLVHFGALNANVGAWVPAVSHTQNLKVLAAQPGFVPTKAEFEQLLRWRPNFEAGLRGEELTAFQTLKRRAGV